jgi:hypothetical protein
MNPDRRPGANLLGHFLGTAYAAGALVADGTPSPICPDPVAEYVPTARPGHRAPHCWLSFDASRVSTLDLFAEHFVVLSRAEDWCAAARRLGAELAVPLDACHHRSLLGCFVRSRQRGERCWCGRTVCRLAHAATGGSRLAERCACIRARQRIARPTRYTPRRGRRSVVAFTAGRRR